MNEFDVLVLAFLHRLQLTEITRQQIEQELNIVNKEKAEIIEQFQHVKRRSKILLKPKTKRRIFRLDDAIEKTRWPKI